jgi:hypothetical protein
MVFATGVMLLHVVKSTPREKPAPATPSCASYAVPGVRPTRLPRHCALRGSNHSGMPVDHAVAPTLR